MTARQGRSKTFGKRNNVSTRVSQPSSKPPLKCFNCCKNGHIAKVCRSEAYCPHCKKKGHSLRDCRSKHPQSQKSKTQTQRNQQPNPSNQNNNQRNPQQDTKRNDATCGNCGRKGHLAKDCKNVKTSTDGKKWPSVRVSDVDITQLTNFSWSNEAISQWSEMIRLSEFEVFYECQIHNLELELKHEQKRKFIFHHHFDGTKKEMLLPSRNFDFNKAKLDEFKAGLLTLRTLKQKCLDKFRKEITSMASAIFDDAEAPNASAYLNSLPQHIADAVRSTSSQNRPTPPQQDRIDKIKKLGEYSETKISTVISFFKRKTEERLNDTELKFSIQRSRQDARRAANQAQQQLDDHEEAIMELMADIVDVDQAPQTPVGGVARNAAANAAARMQVNQN